MLTIIRVVERKWGQRGEVEPVRCLVCPSTLGRGGKNKGEKTSEHWPKGERDEGTAIQKRGLLRSGRYKVGDSETRKEATRR